MSTVVQNLKIEDLTREQKLKLIEELWDSLIQEETPLPVPDWHLEELDRRLALYRDNPTAGSSWEEVKQRLLDAR